MIKFTYQTNSDTAHKTFQDDYLKSMLTKFNKIIDNPKYGFFHLTDKTDYLISTKKIFEKIKHKKHFVQIGIGGSALGPQMLISALANTTDKTFSLMDNTDSDYLDQILKSIDLKESIFYVVSKSGGTAETIACYSIVRNLLKQEGISEENFGDYFVFCTDKDGGQLREHVDKMKYDSLIVPSDVGGRFSVLTHVGLLPAIFFGLDIDALYAGANNIKSTLLNEDTQNNPLLQCAAHTAYLFQETETRVDQTVLMPYSSKLKDFSAWFVQLWAESLGKYSEARKKSVGLTPIPAYGATDQHAQMQLFMEGPNNKLLYMLNISSRKNNYSLDSKLELDSARKLEIFSMNDLLEAEFQGSVKALRENNRNVICINIAELNENSLAQLIIFFESLTALMGEYLLVDPFDQPGVELGKKYAFQYLNSQC